MGAATLTFVGTADTMAKRAATPTVRASMVEVAMAVAGGCTGHVLYCGDDEGNDQLTMMMRMRMRQHTEKRLWDPNGRLGAAASLCSWITSFSPHVCHVLWHGWTWVLPLFRPACGSDVPWTRYVALPRALFAFSLR